MSIEIDTADAVLAEFGQPATVTKPGGDPISTRAIVTPNAEIEREGAYTVEVVTLIALSVADVGKPPRETEIVVGETTYWVDAPASNDGTLTEVIVRDEH